MGLLDAGLGGNTGLLGALTQQDQLAGLLTPFKPSPNESWLEKLVGSGDPRDPRNAASMALAVGLIRGDFAGGLEGYQRAWSGVEDRNTRRAAESLQMRRSLMELSELERQRTDEAGARQVAMDFHARGPQSLTPLPNYPRPMLQAPGMPTSSGGSATQQPGAEGSAPEAMPPLLQPPPGGVPALSALGAPSGASQLFERYNALANAYESKGFVRQAQAAREFALKFKPKFSPTPQVMQDPATGKLVNVLIGEDGTTQMMPYGVKPNIRMQDLGGTVRALDENDLRGSEVFNKTMTPGEVAGNQVALGNLRVSQGQLGLARDRFNAEQSAPQYMQLDGGIYELPKRPGTGAPATARQVTLPNGEPVGGSRPKLTEFQGKSTNYATRMRDATSVLDKLEGQAWPSTVNRAGYQAEAPSWLPGGSVLAGAATAANNMTVPAKAQQLYQAQQNWVTANLRQESGAAIGKDEMASEIRKWFPQAGDGAEVIRQKAEARRVAEEAMMAQAGPGAKLIPGTLDRAAQVNQQRRNAAAEPAQLPANPTAQTLQRGQLYKLPNGQAARWDGFRFVGE